ncbi:Transposase [Rhizoctonia solani]|uniref:Transposase n=1 Tax=Rhizoctonia solani TaxID=456999 RepID=A0A8H7LGZ5_9AGAM|nr:Transposase [Rhizoctonia solani]
MPEALPPSDVQNNVDKLIKGLHFSEIHSQTGASTGMISRIGAMHCPELPKHSGGCPSKLSPTNICHATHLLTGPAPTTPCLVAQELSSTNEDTVSSLTLHWAVQKAGVVPFVKPKKPAMTKEHIKAHYEFAMAHQHWTIDDWKRVQWSDETKINRFGSDGHCYAYKRVGQAPQPHQIIKTNKNGGGHVMIWACMGWKGPGLMCKIDGSLTKELYVEILEDEFKQTLEYYGLDMQKGIFMQDNASSHKAHIIKDWFQENGLEVFEWPANSPDLNPTESLWDQIKRELYSYETPASGMLELLERVQEIWDKVSTQKCQDLIESMPKRIQAWIKAKGGPTKY